MVRFKHGHASAAFHQVNRRSQTGDAAAQNGHIDFEIVIERRIRRHLAVSRLVPIRLVCSGWHSMLLMLNLFPLQTLQTRCRTVAGRASPAPSLQRLWPQRRNAMTRAMYAEKEQRPVRAGVFATIHGAEQAVSGLLDAGFRKEQITVICSDETKEKYFREFEHQESAGSNTPAAAATGGAIGATLGAAATGAVGVATGGLPLLVAGGIGLMAGAVWGGFIGAMLTRGIEKEAANYCDQAVQRGKLLVAVEESESRMPTLAHAERVLARAGAEPLPLTEG